MTRGILRVIQLKRS